MARITKADREALAAAFEAERLAFEAHAVRTDAMVSAYEHVALRALAKQRVKHTEELAAERAICGELIEVLAKIQTLAATGQEMTLGKALAALCVVFNTAGSALKSAGKDS